LAAQVSCDLLVRNHTSGLAVRDTSTDRLHHEGNPDAARGLGLRPLPRRDLPLERERQTGLNRQAFSLGLLEQMEKNAAGRLDRVWCASFMRSAFLASFPRARV
jgi:hypothetical protein